MSTITLAIGGTDRISHALEELSERMDITLLPIPTFDEGFDLLEASPPDYALVDGTQQVGREICLGLRMSAQMAELPIIAAIRDPWSDEVTQAFATGADDYVLSDQLDQLEYKLQALRQEGRAVGARLSGTVVLAHPDRDQRVQLARYLRKMGLDLHFAMDARGIPDDASIRLIVTHHGLQPEGAEVGLRNYRKGEGKNIPWIILAAPPEMENVKEKFSDEAHLSFFELDADPAQIVFTANQLLVGAARSLRRSPRLQHGTPISYTGGKEQQELWGYTYNINRGGLYIRTLTPPELGVELELEFRAPHGRGRVVVEGKVVWRQEYSGERGYPPGFGLQYTTLPLADGAALEAGYNKLLQEEKILEE
jgi:CheY-like chemotaxis protein